MLRIVAALKYRGDLANPRSGHTAILLPNGRVLILGGYGGPSYPLVAPAEIYDSDTGIFTPAGSYAGNGRCDFCAPSTRLADGRVLFPQQNQPQLYDPATSTFRLTGSMIDEQSAATLLMSGKVLFADGEDDFGRKRDAELYDPAAGVFSSIGDMLSKRLGHTLTLLPDGKVLAAGGETDLCNAGFYYFAGTLATAELYDPASGAFFATGNMLAAREGHTATLLNSGRVLLTGGVAYGGIDVFYGSTASAEVYTPEPLVRAHRPFLLTGGEKGQGAIWHSSTGRLASPASPAVTGETLSMYTTGLTEGGKIPPQVFIGGESAEVLYFGHAPGYPGLSQINVRVAGRHRSWISGFSAFVLARKVQQPSHHRRPVRAQVHVQTTLLLIAFDAAACAASMPGTWKMDPARSSFIGAIPPKSLTVRIEPHARGSVFTLDKIEADGRATSSSTILYLDSTPRDLQDFECSGTQSSRWLNEQTMYAHLPTRPGSCSNQYRIPTTRNTSVTQAEPAPDSLEPSHRGQPRSVHCPREHATT